MLGRPIVRLLFERGRFTPPTREQTAAALALYSIGLVAYTGVKVLAPAFYALGTPRVPLLASATAVATNLVVIARCTARSGFRAIALGTALGSLVERPRARRRVPGRRVGGLARARSLAGRRCARMIAAAAGMAPACWFAARWLEARFGTHGLVAQLVTGLGPVAVGGLVYVAASLACRMPEADAILAAARAPPPAA